ncbi:hypothetical protein FA15DRAFT_667134 [Coprinopsis marcescibilis]|uniref:Uncharacterized protein n=1 Tax=Coprinopsis marcescibilis TaxID=230819 RepID=A0A5C3L2A3_COPMA|nr:hypothetical protein FA15DRAFT_667134 [Coprinopsis marcescibilis]
MPTGSIAKVDSPPLQPEASTSKQLPTAKITAVGRFKSFTGSLVPKRSKAPQSTFPPPSWTIEDLNPSSTNWIIPEPEAEPTSGTTGADTEDAKAQETVEPVTFAKRLRAMIEMLPLPGILAASPPTGANLNETPGPPLPPASSEPPPPVPPGMDENLMRMLSSEEVMNGESEGEGKGKGRPGIWNILASLGRSNDTEDQKGDDKSILSIEDQNSGVMMYAPLDPESDSVVELASTQTVQQQVGPASSTQTPNTVETSLWVPSTTELSVLTAWWGYRLYLPPPVMNKLGATSVKAAARAAMITTALKWLIDKIPLMLIPVQFRPAVKMLKMLAPSVGYIGVFVAWSWDRIRTFDEGNGIVLSATWILPVALIPMAWDAGNIQGPLFLPEEVRGELEDAKANKGEEQIPKGKDVAPDQTEQKKKKKSRFVW